MPNMPKGRFFPVQSLNLGPTGVARTFHSATLPYGGQLGQVYEQNGSMWRLVQYHKGVGNVDTIDGGTMYWRDRANNVVTADASDGEALANGVAGGIHIVLTNTANHLEYCFIQCGGDQAAVVVAASAVASDHLSGHASTDNVLTRTAAGTANVNLTCAIALTTRGTTTSDSGASVTNSSKVRWVFGNLV